MTQPTGTDDDRQVVVVGAGPAGLTMARLLAERGGVRLTVLDREAVAGGAPRHTDHLGFGLRDLHRLTSGPRYARRLLAAAQRAGAEVRTGATVLAVEPGGPRRLEVCLATGERLAADAVVLATGVRERPRSARLVPGDRPAGVFTTGAVQQVTALHHGRVGTRAVVVGAEHVSFSAIWSLQHGSCRTVALVTPLPRHQTVAALRWFAAGLRRIPVRTGVEVAEIVGRGRVEAVVLTDGTRIDCDTVVFTGDWIPEHEVARRAGLTMTPAAKGPAVDAAMRTSTRGLFAVGNLVHPAETADRCALDAHAASDAVRAWLTDRQWPAAIAPIDVEPPLLWAAWCAGGITARVEQPTTGRLEVSVDGVVVHRGRRRRLVPNRALVVRNRRLAALRAGAPDSAALGDAAARLHVSIVR